MPAVVRTDIAVISAVMIRTHDFQNPHVTVTVAVGSLREIPIRKMFDVSDMRKGNSVTISADNIRHIIFAVCPQRARAQAQTITGVVHH